MKSNHLEMAKPDKAHHDHGAQIHYGKKFAETQELYHAHEMAHQLEKLAGVAPVEEPKQEVAQAPEAAKTEEPVKAQTAPAEQTNTAPIGALPAKEDLPTQGLWADVTDQVTENFKAVQDSASQLVRASYHLMRLPLDIARTVLHGGRTSST